MQISSLPNTAANLSLANIKALIDIWPVGSTMLDPDGTIVYANQRFANFVGYPTEELVGMRPEEFTHPEDHAATVENLTKLREGTLDDFVLEKRYRRKDGAVVSGLTSVTVMHMDDRPGYILASIDDLTSRTRAEQLINALARSAVTEDAAEFFRRLTQELATTLEVSHAFITETVGNDRVRTLAFWSDGAHVDQIEYALSETPCERVAYSGKDAFFSSGVQEAFPNDPDLVDLGAEGYVGVPMFGRSETPIGHLAILHRGPLIEADVPLDALRIFAARGAAELERAKAEEAAARYAQQVQHRQKLESLGMFAGGIAHDFNNVLMAIVGNMDLARKTLPTESRERVFMDRAASASRDAAELAKQLLDYAGKGSDPMEPVDLSDVVQNSYPLLRTAHAKNAELRFDLARHLPAVRVSNSQVRQVLMNLVRNASDALGNETDGDITVRTDTVNLSSQLSARLMTPLAPGRFVRLSVADNGPGMSEHTLAQIFEPFYTTKRGGRGLGMGVVMGIATRHGGSVAVHSALGAGTTVEVLFPAIDAVANGPDLEHRAQADRQRGTVLVIDDELVVAQVCAEYLMYANFGAVMARDGEQGVALFQQFADRETPFSAVILDLAMPRMDGVATFRAIRAIDPNARIVLSTGYDAHNHVSTLRNEGVDGVLQKPFTLEALLDVLEGIGVDWPD